jgi:hypothetical protein
MQVVTEPSDDSAVHVQGAHVGGARASTLYATFHFLRCADCRAVHFRPGACCLCGGSLERAT